MPWPLPDQSVFHDGRVIPQLSAEDYGEPQTRPAAPAGQNEDRWKFSTAEKGAEPAILGRARTEIEERRRGRAVPVAGGSFSSGAIHGADFPADGEASPTGFASGLLQPPRRGGGTRSRIREASEMGCAAAGRLCVDACAEQKFGSGIFLGTEQSGAETDHWRGEV